MLPDDISKKRFQLRTYLRLRFKLNQVGKALYSAAWKLLGRALSDDGRAPEALEAYRSGIAAAEKKGDKQAGKEMAVFAKRIEKVLAADGKSTPEEG